MFYTGNTGNQYTCLGAQVITAGTFHFFWEVIVGGVASTRAVYMTKITSPFTADATISGVEQKTSTSYQFSFSSAYSAN